MLKVSTNITQSSKNGVLVQLTRRSASALMTTSRVTGERRPKGPVLNHRRAAATFAQLEPDDLGVGRGRSCARRASWPSCTAGSSTGVEAPDPSSLHRWTMSLMQTDVNAYRVSGNTYWGPRHFIARRGQRSV